MKYFYLLIVLALLVCGCKTFEQNAYRTLATTSTLVDNSMKAWADYVVKGLAKPEDETKVRAAYVKYQKTMTTAKVAIYAYRASKKDNENELNAALNAVGTSAMDVVKLIQELTKKE